MEGQNDGRALEFYSFSGSSDVVWSLLFLASEGRGCCGGPLRCCGAASSAWAVAHRPSLLADKLLARCATRTSNAC